MTNVEILFTVLWVDIEESSDEGNPLPSLQSEAGHQSHRVVQCEEEQGGTGQIGVTTTTNILIAGRI